MRPYGQSFFSRPFTDDFFSGVHGGAVRCSSVAPCCGWPTDSVLLTYSGWRTSQGHNGLPK